MKRSLKLLLALALSVWTIAVPVLAQEAGQQQAAQTQQEGEVQEGEAQEEEEAAPVVSNAILNQTGSLGAGLIILGAAYGIGKLASASFESMARQPEVANSIRGAMIIAAALIEGATFFALIVCIIVG